MMTGVHLGGRRTLAKRTCDDRLKGAASLFILKGQFTRQTQGGFKIKKMNLIILIIILINKVVELCTTDGW